MATHMQKASSQRARCGRDFSSVNTNLSPWILVLLKKARVLSFHVVLRAVVSKPLRGASFWASGVWWAAKETEADLVGLDMLTVHRWVAPAKICSFPLQSSAVSADTYSLNLKPDWEIKAFQS